MLFSISKKRYGFTLGALLVSSACWGTCPSFAGNYVQRSGAITNSMHIEQTECLQLDMAFDFNHQIQITQTRFLDGQSHEIFQSPESISTETAHWLIDRIQYESTDYYIPENKTYKTKGLFYLDRQGHLIDEQQPFDENGTPLRPRLIQWSRVVATPPLEMESLN